MAKGEGEQEGDPAAAVEAMAEGAPDNDGGSEFIPGGEGDGEAEQGPSASAEVVRTLAATVSAVLAGRRGEHWHLSAQELEQVAQSGGECLDKYAPDMACGPEASLVLVMGAITLPRVAVDKQKEAERQAAEARAKREAETGGEQTADEAAKRAEREPET